MASVTPISANKVQTCPHGLPFGACSICNGGGGGMKSQKTDSTPKQTMSLSAMYAFMHRKEALEARKEAQKNELLAQNQNLLKTKEALNNMMNKLEGILNKIENILPKPILKAFNEIVQNVLKPLSEIIQKFPETVKNFKEFIQNIKTQAFIAAEKLASVFGEIKNFIQKSISNSFKKFTKKVYKILNLFGLNTNEDYEEDERVNSEIYTFKTKDVKNLKEIMLKLITKKEKRTHDDTIPHKLV